MPCQPPKVSGKADHAIRGAETQLGAESIRVPPASRRCTRQIDAVRVDQNLGRSYSRASEAVPGFQRRRR